MKCPICSSREVVEGRVLSSDDGAGAKFYPDGIRFLSVRRSVPLAVHQRFKACVACGHVWNQVDPHELAEFIEGHGTAEAKAKLGNARSVDHAVAAKPPGQAELSDVGLKPD